MGTAAATENWKRTRVANYSKPDPPRNGNGTSGQCYSAEMPRAPADAATGHAAARAAGRVRVPGDKSISHRYAMLAALADGPSRHHAATLRGADCAATLACLRGARRASIRGTPSVDLDDRRPRAGRPAAAGRPARRGQLRHDDAAAGGSPGRPPLSHGHRRRRLALPPADAARHRAADRHGRAHRVGGRPAAAHHRRRAAARHHPPARGAERAGQERRPARRPARRRADDGASSPSPTRDHTERALRGVRRRACAGPALPSRRRADSACSAADLHRPGRHLERDVLARARGRDTGCRHRDRGRRTEPIAHRACSRCSGGPAPESTSRSTTRTAGEPVGTHSRFAYGSPTSFSHRAGRSAWRHRRDSRRWPRSARCCPRGRDDACAAPASCASRRAIASRARGRAYARWVHRSRSTTTGSGSWRAR